MLFYVEYNYSHTMENNAMLLNYKFILFLYNAAKILMILYFKLPVC